MKSIKNRLFAVAIIAGLAVIGSVMNSRQSIVQGAAGPTVTIDQAQLPLPVQGSLGVSGSVAATQSGPWNVEITGTPAVNINNTVNPLHVLIASPANAFSTSPQQVVLGRGGDPNLTPDPSGTRYAISSFTVSNPTSITSEIHMSAVAVNASPTNCFLSPINVVAEAQGPRLTVAAQSSATLTFPQPFITAPVSGLAVCLMAAGDNTTGMTWSAVGFKILP